MGLARRSRKKTATMTTRDETATFNSQQNDTKKWSRQSSHSATPLRVQVGKIPRGMRRVKTCRYKGLHGSSRVFGTTMICIRNDNCQWLFFQSLVPLILNDEIALLDSFSSSFDQRHSRRSPQPAQKNIRSDACCWTATIDFDFKVERSIAYLFLFLFSVVSVVLVADLFSVVLLFVLEKREEGLLLQLGSVLRVT
jgi:hypothetical protein